MYVCVCKAVTDSQIRNAVQEGITSMSGLRRSLGCSGQCGKCGKHVKQVRDEALLEAGTANLGSAIPVLAAV